MYSICIKQTVCEEGLELGTNRNSNVLSVITSWTFLESPRSYNILYIKVNVNFYSEKAKKKSIIFTATQLIAVNQNYFLPAYSEGVETQ